MLRTFVGLLGLVAISVSACQVRTAEGEDASGTSRLTEGAPLAECRTVDPVKRECTYKTVGGLTLTIDVFRKEGTDVRPALLWLHPGALIFGNRNELSAEQRNRYLANRYVVTSIDYRLAPETKIDEIHTDVADAYAWLRRNAQGLGIDGDRIGIVGHSAGGYLTLMAGARLSPPPKALVAFYGYGDLGWYRTPVTGGAENCPDDPLLAFPAGAPIAHTEDEEEGGASSYDDTSACSGTQSLRIRSLGDEETTGENENENENENEGDDDATTGGESPEADKRGNIYACAREKGYWPQVVGGKDPDADPSWLASLEPIKNVTKAYPPTLLLHGPADDDVPFSRAQAMVTALEGKVEVSLVTDTSWGHMFDGDFCNPTVQSAFTKVIAFLDGRLKKPAP